MNTLQPLLWTIRAASALGFTALSLTGEITGPYIPLCWAVWLASFWLDRRPAWETQLRRWETPAVIGLVSVFALDFFVWEYSIFISVAHFLLLFQMFKLLGLKTRKDSLQILIFSFFQLLSACTLAVDVWQAAILFLLIPIATAGLFWQQISREAEEAGQPVPLSASQAYRRWVTGICLTAIPINMLLAGTMFMIFPRLAFRGAFAGLGSGRSGYNEQVNLAQSGVIGLDNSTVMWLQITPATDHERWNGYLRGGTLDFFDGKKWSRSQTMVAQTMFADSNGVFKLVGRTGQRGFGFLGSRALRQNITLVNTAGATLFGSPTVGEVVAPLSTLQRMSDGGIRWTSGWRKPLHYEVLSFDQPLLDPPRHRPDYLGLPNRPFTRTRALAHQIAGKRRPWAQAKAIESYLRSNFQYSLSLGTMDREDPVDDFLFVRRRGPCGYFASAMAVMLRLQGIPSRVVAGYYKGTWNNRLEQYLIRERDAHAWVEAYFPDRGWVQFDPSPRPTAPPVTELWRVRLQENWEYLNYQWDRLVMEYDLYSQVKVVEDIQSNTNRINATISGWVDKYLMGKHQSIADKGRQKPERKLSFAFLLSLICGVMMSIGVLQFCTRRLSVKDPSIAFYQKFLDQMARKGCPKSASETGWEFAERLQARPESTQAHEITRRYYLARFAHRA